MVADDREKRLAALAWAVSGAFGPVVPLVIFALNHKKSKFIGFHALQAALSFLAIVAVAMIAGLVMGGSAAWVMATDGVPAPGTPMPEAVRTVMLILGGLTVAVYCVLVVASLRFASRASQGVWVRYPGVSRLAATLFDVSDVRVVAAESGPSA